MTLRLPLDVLDAAESISKRVGAVKTPACDTDGLGLELRAARLLIAKEVMLGLFIESDVTSGVALTCTVPDTVARMLFVILGFFVRLFSEVEVLGRLAVGAAGNAGRSGCPEVGVLCASVCRDIGVFCVFSTLLFT
jgi:hypothetical protein